MGDAADDVWDKAIESYKAKSPKHRKRWAKCTTCSLVELTDAIQRLLDKQSHAPGRFVKRLREVCCALQRLAPVGDVLSQLSPHAGSPIWGSLRFLILIAASEAAITIDIDATVLLIVRQIGRFELEIRLNAVSNRVIDACVCLFTAVIDYLLEARSFLTNSLFVRTFMTVFKTPQLNAISKGIHDQAMLVDKEIQTAERSRARKFQSDMQESSRKQRSATQTGLKRQVQMMHSHMEFQQDMMELDYRRRFATIQDRLTKNKCTEPTDEDNFAASCQWILSHPLYRRWYEMNDSQFLWINGSSGCGKTVLSRYVAQAISRQDRIVLRHTFSKINGTDATTVRAFAVSMLYDLCQDIDRRDDRHRRTLLLNHLRFILNSGSNSANWPLDGLLRAIKETLSRTSRPVIIIDALEELHDPGGSAKLYRLLSSIQKRYLAALMIYSQPIEWILELDKPVQIHMSYALMWPQIRTFVDAEVKRHRELNCLKLAAIYDALDRFQSTFLTASILLAGLIAADTPLQQKEVLAKASNEVLRTLQSQIDSVGHSMTAPDRQCRQIIFQILVVERRTLSVEELTQYLAVETTTDSINFEKLFLNPERKFLALCEPLVEIVQHELHFKHGSGRECLLRRQVDLQVAEEDLALRSLSILLQAPYNTWQYASNLLRRDLLPGNLLRLEIDKVAEKEPPHYNYACLHWFEHLTSVSAPSDTIIEKLVAFLQGYAFVTWSEVFFDLRGRISLAAQAVVFRSLSKWAKTLPDDVQSIIAIEDFFESPHNSLSLELSGKGDNLAPYLPLWRIGEYLDNNGARVSEDVRRAFEYKSQVADGFESVLGENNPLSLRARSTMYGDFFYLFPSRYDEGVAKIQQIATKQRELALDPTVADLFQTLQLLGWAQFLINQYDEATVALTEAFEGLQRIYGDEAFPPLKTRLFQGFVAERLGDLQSALDTYRQILNLWVPIVGKENAMALFVEAGLGSVHCKLDDYDQAQDLLQFVWKIRQDNQKLGINVGVDSGISLAALYREKFEVSRATDTLNIVTRSPIYSEDFERRCQIEHVRALLQFDAGMFEEPKRLLEGLLDEVAGEHRILNNRELLWIRLDLADVYQQKDPSDEGLILFEQLVEPVYPRDEAALEDDFVTIHSLDDEPEPASQLRAARDALKLVRTAREAQAKVFLAERGLRWVSKKDFWIRQGGPITDTAWMSGPRLNEASISR